MKDLAALILAAGKGTRMRSETAKVLHPLLGRPLLAYPLEACRDAGIGRLVAVIGHQADRVRSVLGAPDLTFVHQAEQRGTAHAVACARESLQGFEGSALILCGDVPLICSDTLSLLVRTHRKAGALVTVLSMEPADASGYGRLLRDDGGKLLRIVEEKDAAPAERSVREVNTGTYAVEVPWLWHALEQIGPENSQGEYYLTDVVEIAAREGHAESHTLEDPREVIGVNSRAHLAEVATILRRRINCAWMESGVTLEDPETTWIEPDVILDPDTVVGPACRLTGPTRVARGTRLDQGVVVDASEIGPDVHIKPYCVLSEARVGAGAQVGPFAHLRPGAVLNEEAKVGNFVEMKKSVLGRASKANHLTYLGDTTVGANANIGAGTITCNYDGVHKHKTRIGDGAFIGSNASLVAPVEVGNGATVAAGSTVTHNVPNDGLGMGRARQRNIEGWNVRKRRSPREE